MRNPSAADWNGASPPRRLDLVNPDGDDDAIGRLVAGVGDVNGDGYADFLIRSEGSHCATGEIPSAVYLYLGSAMPDAAAWNTSPYTLRAKIAVFAESLAGVGDVNGDGYSDFVIVPPIEGVFEPHPVPVRLYLGSAAARGADWNAESTSQRIDVGFTDSSLGYGPVAGVGDVDVDGYSDFLIGLFAYFSERPASAYLYLGSAAPRAADWNASSPARRIALTGGAGVDGSVSGAGDVDGDGHADFLVGDPDTGTGAVHLYLGTAAPGPATWNGATSSRRIDLPNPSTMPGRFGAAIAGGGDVDGDGHADFLASGQGAAYLHLGMAAPSAAAWSGASNPRRIDLTQVTGGVARASPRPLSRYGRCAAARAMAALDSRTNRRCRRRASG